jgi:hypothetical protein
MYYLYYANLMGRLQYLEMALLVDVKTESQRNDPGVVEKAKSLETQEHCHVAALGVKHCGCLRINNRVLIR